MKLNLGCGQQPKPGYVNVDIEPGPGVDAAWDLEQTPWPVPDSSVSEILADNVFEHLNRFDRVWSEIHRVLEPGGRVHAWVPYGLRWFEDDPYHVHPWTERTVLRLLDLHSCAMDRGRAFRLVSMKAIGSGFPWWHMGRYLGYIPKFRRVVLEFVMEKMPAAEQGSKSPMPEQGDSATRV